MEEQQFSYQNFVDLRPALGGRDLGFGAAALICGWLLCNFTLFGGLNLGFSIAACLTILLLTVYLLGKGRKVSVYSLTLLVLCAVMAAGFARTDDTLVKIILVLFLMAGALLGFCQLSGKSRRMPGSVLSLFEGIGVLFEMGFGKLSESLSGLNRVIRGSGKIGKNTGAVVIGLLIAIPVLLILVPLLVSADAAFEGLLQQLPEINLLQLFVTLLYGTFLGWITLSYGMGLRHYNRRPAVPKPVRKGVNVLTLNTVLCVVSLLYVVYLVSQLAYFTGGMSGILPEEYTLAQYARRGFFEMAWLCAMNLGIMVSCMALSKDAPLSTRLLCLFLGIVAVFFVATASAKMFLYIGSYGLTRLRVLTQIVMLFLVVVTVLVSVWLFVPKLPYMKVIVVCALIIGSALVWVDVDTQVARYNVYAYLSGELETVDVKHLYSLGDGAVPYLAQLAQEAPDQQIAEKAQNWLDLRHADSAEDFRSWNYVNYTAEAWLPPAAEE